MRLINLHTWEVLWTEDLKGETDAVIKVRIGKARSAYKRMKNVYNSSSLKTRTKVRIFNSAIKPVLLYGSDTWTINVDPIKKVQLFINTCLRRILKIHWTERITYDEQWRSTRQRPVQNDITENKWRWIGNTQKTGK